MYLYYLTKAFFGKIEPLINLNIAATAQLENF